MRIAASISAGAALWAVGAAQETGEHTDWPRWCGKVYESGYPSFEPGGHTTRPADTNTTNLHVQLKPRYSIYLDGETTASFVVNAALSSWHGLPWTNSTSDGVSTKPFDTLYFSINVVSDGSSLVESKIAVDAVGAEFEFDLSALSPSMAPYQVVFYGASEYGEHIYNATTSLRYLPRNPTGSATKIDNLKGSLLFQTADTGDGFRPFLPYGYYGTYNGSNCSAASDEFVQNYTSRGQGLNAIIALAGFDDSNPVYTSMDQQSLHFMYDLRGWYTNLSVVEEKVNAVKHRPALFAYWTADE